MSEYGVTALTYPKVVFVTSVTPELSIWLINPWPPTTRTTSLKERKRNDEYRIFETLLKSGVVSKAY